MVDSRNPQYPHRIKVIRAKQDENGNSVLDEDSEEIMETILDTICGLRPMTRGLDIDAPYIKADYLVSIPKHGLIIKKGDAVEFVNSINNELKTGLVEDANEGNLGAYLTFNQHGNG